MPSENFGEKKKERIFLFENAKFHSFGFINKNIPDIEGGSASIAETPKKEPPFIVYLQPWGSLWTTDRGAAMKLADKWAEKKGERACVFRVLVADISNPNIPIDNTSEVIYIGGAKNEVPDNTPFEYIEPDETDGWIKPPDWRGENEK